MWYSVFVLCKHQIIITPGASSHAQSPPSTKLLYAYKYNNMLMVGSVHSLPEEKLLNLLFFLAQRHFLEKVTSFWLRFSCN